jgi:hypothetical protein
MVVLLLYLRRKDGLLDHLVRLLPPLEELSERVMQIHEVSVPLVDDPLGSLALLVLHFHHVLDVVALVGELPLQDSDIESHSLFSHGVQSSVWMDVVVYYLEVINVKLIL